MLRSATEEEQRIKVCRRRHCPQRARRPWVRPVV